MNILTLQEAKEYLRIEQADTEEDNLINGLLEAAENYITNATDNTFDDTNELAKLAIKLLIVHWYENRSAVVIGTISKGIEFALNSIITQLKYCYSGDA